MFKVLLLCLLLTTGHGSWTLGDEPRATDPVPTLEGVKPTQVGALPRLTAVVNDEQIYFRVLKPTDLKYDASIVTRDGVKVFQFYTAMPSSDIVIAFEPVTGVQLFTPNTTQTIEAIDPSVPEPRTELQTKIDALGLTPEQREQASAAIARALVSSSGNELIQRAFTGLKPLVTPDWKPFLTWLQADFESKEWTDETLKTRIQELADAFAK